MLRYARILGWTDVNRSHVHSLRCAAPLILWMLIALVWGCQPASSTSQRLGFKIIDGAFRVTPDRSEEDVLPIYDIHASEIRMDIARNEARGFYLVLDSGENAYPEVSVAADQISGAEQELDSNVIQIYRSWFVELEELPGWYHKAISPHERQPFIPDVLIPAEAPKLGQPYDLDEQQKLYLWVDVRIPPAAQAGAYYSMLRIHSRNNELLALPIVLNVLPLELPNDVGVSLIAPLNLQKLMGHHVRLEGQPHVPDRFLEGDPLYEQSGSLIQRSMLLLVQHGLSPVITGLYPVVKLDERGELIVMWDEYDRVLEGYLNGQMFDAQSPPTSYPIPFSATFPEPPPYDPLTSPTYTRSLRQYLTLCAEHFWERGWLDRAYVMLPEEIDMQTTIQRARRYAVIARLADSRLRTACTVPPQNMARYGWKDYPQDDLSGYVDIWAPKAQFYDAAVFSQPPFSTGARWVTLDRPPYSGSIELCGHDTYARVIPWQAQLLQAEAVLLPEANNWTEDYTVVSPVEHIQRTPAPLILPGSFCGLDEPLPTLRLKMLRRGMNDLAYLSLCRARGHDQLADAILRSLCTRAGADTYGVHFADGIFSNWQSDPTWWNYARRLMIDALVEPNEGDEQEALSWLRFKEATQSVRLRSRGVCVQFHGDAHASENPSFVMTFHLTLDNHTSEPLNAYVRLGELPIGWQTAEGGQSIENLEPYQSRLLSLTVNTEVIPSDADGSLLVPIVIETAKHHPPIQEVRISHILAKRQVDPIALDGDLTDWSGGIGNVAGDFKPISLAPSQTEESPGDSPIGQTLGFVTVDEHYLYFGFQCFTNSPLKGTQIFRNFVAYDDRLPVREELLEILIDPLNGRSTSPEDLYHIAVKPSGACYAEKGILSSPQIGKVENWPTHIEVATQTLEDRWIAELRIPRSAFEGISSRNTTWGINFARYDQSLKIYSTWSSATWNPYDPSSLGNLSFAD